MPRLSEDQLVSTMVQRYGYPEHVARGVVMNWRDESGLDTGIQERAPIAGRGGYGLAQWTGPRRVALEQFAAEQGKDVSDPDVQLDFFHHENTTSEKAAWDKVLAAKTQGEAGTNFLNYWERPSADNAAKRAASYGGAAAGSSSGGGSGGGSAPNPNDPWSEENRQKLAALWAKQNQPKSMVNEIGDALSGLKFPTAQLAGTNQLRPAPEAARVDAEAVAPVTPLGADRRQVLTQLMAQLNSGRLFG